MVRQANHTHRRARGESLSQPGDDAHDDEPDHNDHVKTHHDDEDEEEEEDDDDDDGETTTTTTTTAAAATTTTTAATTTTTTTEGTPPGASRGPPQIVYKIMFPEALPGTCMFLLPHDAFQESSRSAPRTAQDGAHRGNANQHSDVSGSIEAPTRLPKAFQRLP